MKISLGLGPRQPLSRQTAWGCFTANAALPGSGSLAAGRATGYAQLVLALGGTLMSLAFAARFAAWYAANAARLRELDPAEGLKELLLAMRWPMAGIAVFALGWLWALGTSLALLCAARRSEAARKPPVL